jgi:P27 family predicted phage terminase small subunit
VQIAEGDPTKRGVHKLDARREAEARATRGLQRCPAHLTGEARKTWLFWSRELEAMELDCRPDGPMLEGACVAYSTYVKMHRKIEEQGELVARKERNPATNQLEVVDVRPHPALRIRDRALGLLRSFCSEFGLSPVSRVRLSVQPREAGTDDLMALLTQPRDRKEQQQPQTETIQ